MTRHPARSLVFLAAFLVAVSLRAAAPLTSQTTTSAAFPPETPDAAHLKLAIDKLGVVGRALYIGAHPDDENTAMLAWLANGRLVRAAYLSMTRGDGGQNLIGNEKGDLLGVIRTEELLAARNVDKAEQFFSRAIDFGYSKNPEETMRIWGHDAALADVVWVIRLYRPDVLITRFPTTGEGGHGHHTASAILAQEAFTAAADPKKFPEQLQYVQPWQPRRIFWNRFTWTNQPIHPDAKNVLSVDLGAYNPLLGRSYNEIAAESRSMHKSQGFGSAQRRGPSVNELELTGGDAPAKDLFDGIDLTWSRVRGGEETAGLLARASREFDAAHPEKSVPVLAEAWRAMNAIKPADAWTADVLAEKKHDLAEAIRGAAGLWLESIATAPAATAGSDVTVNAVAIERASVPMRLEKIELPDGTSIDVSADLAPNAPLLKEVKARIPATAEAWQPYWLRDTPGSGMYKVADQRLVGQPDNAPALPVTFVVSVAGQSLRYPMTTFYRWTDRVSGEHYRPFEIVPPVTVNLGEKVYLYPTADATQTVRVRAVGGSDGATGTVSLRTPYGSRVEPKEVPVTFAKKGDDQVVTFRVTAPAEAREGSIQARFDAQGQSSTRSLVTIDYPHIPERTIFPPAESKVLRIDVARKGERVGYVMGAGDEVPDALEQLGYQVTMLSDADLEAGDLSRFDAIVTGVRAYNTRDILKARPQLLLDYVKNGGTLVVQYNTDDDTLARQIGPWPMKVSRDRVTVEEAPVKLLAPDNALLNTPNKITAADFDGWIQERGIYFPSEWDPQYTALLSSHDPGEPDRNGGLLVGKYGKGTFIYTGYVFFRELPAGVPGAYRLFANLVSAK